MSKLLADPKVEKLVNDTASKAVKQKTKAALDGIKERIKSIKASSLDRNTKREVVAALNATATEIKAA